MNKQKEYIAVERKRITELIAKIDNLWILGQVYKFIVNVVKYSGEDC